MIYYVNRVYLLRLSWYYLSISYLAYFITIWDVKFNFGIFFEHPYSDYFWWYTISSCISAIVMLIFPINQLSIILYYNMRCKIKFIKYILIEILFQKYFWTSIFRLFQMIYYIIMYICYCYADIPYQSAIYHIILQYEM